METFDKLLNLQKELLQSQLKIILRHQRRFPGIDKKEQRKSKLDIAEDILRSADKHLHITKIIEIAQNDYQVKLERDSIVSALAKKINAGERFIRVGPNTFGLKK